MKDGIIDWWIVPHFLLWAVIVGWLRWFFVELPLPWALVVVGYGSIAWEAIESYREIRLGYTPEPWYNRLIVDPLTNTSGALAGWFLVDLVF